MRCHNCKTKNPPGAVRCSNCFCILDQEKPSSLKALLSKVKQLIGSVVAFMSRRKKLLFVGICVALILIILPLILIILPIVGPSLNNFMSQITRLFTGSSSTSLQLPNGLGVVKAPNGQYVGINDGTYHPFDQERNDSQNLRQQAMQSLQSGASDASSTAISLWSDYLSGDNVNDAEIYIYRANQQINHFPHVVTLILGLDFPASYQTPNAIAATWSALQGAYIAQQEFNNKHSDIKLRLLLANTGDNSSYVSAVAHQIASIVKQDKTVIGILGWQTSARTKEMLDALQKVGINIPMVSQTASSDEIQDIAPNFFSIAPPDSAQAQMAISLTKRLQSTQAIVFKDKYDLYSQNLALDFEQQFHCRPSNCIEKPFRVEQTKTANYSAELQQALKQVHDSSHLVVLFTGTTNYDGTQFQNALANFSNTSFLVIAGDAGYIANPPSAGRWYVLAYAFHDQWQALMGNTAAFSQEYSQTFNPDEGHPGYYYNLPDSVAIISYDAAKVLSRGIDIALSKGITNPTPQDLESALSSITGSQALQGVSGIITFDANHNPTNKALIALQLDAHKHFQMVCMQGTFSSKANNSIPAC